MKEEGGSRKEEGERIKGGRKQEELLGLNKHETKQTLKGHNKIHVQCEGVSTQCEEFHTDSRHV